MYSNSFHIGAFDHNLAVRSKSERSRFMGRAGRNHNPEHNHNHIPNNGQDINRSIKIDLPYLFTLLGSVSVLVSCMSLILQLFVNYVPGAFCSLEPSMERRSGTPISVMNIFNAIPASYFLAMGYTPAKKVPLDKT